MAIVPEPLRVIRDQLLRWGARAEAAGQLPKLIRSLVAETEPSVEWIDMPAGTGVAAPSWDGIVRCSEGHRFVPPGLSCWEFSTEQKNSHGKALEDYEKRVMDTPRNERAGMAYVAVVCAPWTKARDFTQEKLQRDDFRLVQGLNVDSIEAWLECAPVSTVWLREVMGEPVAGVGLLSRWWGAWLESTSVPLDAGIVLAGRDRAAETLLNRCGQQGGGVITVGGDMHRDEILAFVAAALVTTTQGESPRQAILYIDDDATAKRLLATGDPINQGQSSASTAGLTVVVPSVEFTSHLPPNSSYRLVVPVPGSPQAEIKLGALDTSSVAAQMEALGQDSDKSHDLGALARMSLLTLRRRLANQPELYQPAWAAGSINRTLRRSLLLNSWSQRSDGDADIVRRFTGSSHSDVAEMLHNLTGASEPPMLLTDDRWHVVAPADAWSLISGQITRDDLDSFAGFALEVLTDPDPFLGMSDVERMQAEIGGTTAKHSSHIKRGIATTLALLGTFPPRLRGDMAPAASAAEGIVSQILGSANEAADPSTWASVSEVLPLLVEAAPEAVLTGLRSCLSTPHPFAEVMFSDGQANLIGLPSASPHLRILEALEVLAWSPNHFEGVVDVLAGLAAVDPGGTWGNRPDKSLESIMWPSSPQTSAGGEDRLQALDMLRCRHKPVAWDLMLTMLPSGPSSVLLRRGPRYRAWKNGPSVVTRSQRGQTYSEVAARLVHDAGSDPERVKVLIEHVSDLPPDVRESLQATLENIALSEPDEEIRCSLWPALRRTISYHRGNGDTGGTLSVAELEQFEALMDRLHPSDPLTAYGMLFDGGFGSIDGISPRDYEAYIEVRATRQADAVVAMHDSGGITAVLDFAANVREPRNVGEALAATGSDVDEEMLTAMNSAPETVTQVALGYFATRFREFQWDGIDYLIDRHSLSAQVMADLVRACPPKERPWRKATELGTEVAAEYWTRVEYWSVGLPEDHAELLEVTQGLRGAGRADFAAWLLSLQSNGFASEPEFAEEAANCLEEWIRQGTPLTSAFDGHDLSSLMKVLDQNVDHLGTDRVVMIEWQYYPALKHAPDFEAPNLYRSMAHDPNFFVSLVESVFKPASARREDQPEPSVAERQLASKAYSLLESWPQSGIFPGLDEGGNIVSEQFNNWIDHARSLLAEKDRSAIGDQQIGKVLAVSPPGPDGEWPSAAVRDLIERLQSDHIDSGLSVAIQNQRGVTTRGPYDGGDQERNLAEKYRQTSSRFSTSPRTRAIFEDLASCYDEQAAWHDRQAEAHRRGLPL